MVSKLLGPCMANEQQPNSHPHHSMASVCYGYGTPACVDDTLLPRLLTCRSDVNHQAVEPKAWSPRLDGKGQTSK